jgi:hypothetical protein
VFAAGAKSRYSREGKNRKSPVNDGFTPEKKRANLFD